MAPLQHTTTAFLTGLVAGFLVSIPVGPINLTIINEGARRGFRWALLIGFGSVLMESIYCGFALTGFSAFLGIPMVKSTMELLSFLFLLALSWKYFLAKSIPSHTHGADVIEQKLHPRSAFMIGFIRVLGNPSVLLLWVTLTATFLSHNWVDRTVDDRIACVLGVASGAALWFVLLAYVVSRGHGRISPRTLLRMEHVSGALLLAAALWIGGRIIWQLHKQNQNERVRPENASVSLLKPEPFTALHGERILHNTSIGEREMPMLTVRAAGKYILNTRPRGILRNGRARAESSEARKIFS